MNKKQGVFSMKQGIGNIAVEGKHIVKDFRLGATTTKGLKDISLQVMQGGICVNHGTIRLREKHAALYSWGTGCFDQWPRPFGRHRHFRVRERKNEPHHAAIAIGRQKDGKLQKAAGTDFGGHRPD